MEQLPIRNIYGNVTSSVEEEDGFANGVFKLIKQHFNGADYRYGSWGFSFDASRVVPVAVENRPVNKAVRYFIKAK